MNTKEFLKAELDKLDSNAYWEIDGCGNTEFVCRVMELYADAVNKNAVLPHVSNPVCPYCGTDDIIYRFKTNSFICHRCVDVEWANGC